MHGAGSSKLAGSPNLMVGKPSTPTSSPKWCVRLQTCQWIFGESTLRPPTHGFSITNAVLPMLYCGKHLWHVATCFDKKPQLITLHMSRMSYVLGLPPNIAPFIISSPQPALHIAHEDGGMTVVLLHQLIPCRFHGLQRLVPSVGTTHPNKIVREKVAFKLTPYNSCHVSVPKKAFQSSQFCWICLEQKRMGNWEVYSKSNIIPSKNTCLAMAAPRGVELDKHLGGSKGCSKGATEAQDPRKFGTLTFPSSRLDDKVGPKKASPRWELWAVNHDNWGKIRFCQRSSRPRTPLPQPHTGPGGSISHPIQIHSTGIRSCRTWRLKI